MLELESMLSTATTPTQSSAPSVCSMFWGFVLEGSKRSSWCNSSRRRGWSIKQRGSEGKKSVPLPFHGCPLAIRGHGGIKLFREDVVVFLLVPYRCSWKSSIMNLINVRAEFSSPL